MHDLQRLRLRRAPRPRPGPAGTRTRPGARAERRARPTPHRRHALVLPDEGPLTTLAIKDVPKGATVTAKCPKGCARKTYTKRNARGTVNLRKLTGGRRIKAGTTITVTVTRPGEIGAVKKLVVRAGRNPKITTRCLKPGAKKPGSCS